MIFVNFLVNFEENAAFEFIQIEELIARLEKSYKFVFIESFL
jgi:hypothetical protein